MSDVRPAWPGQGEPQPPPPADPPPPDQRSAFDLHIIIPVLIGLVSVTGAVLTWRSAQLGETATDKDRQAVAETVLTEQAEANAELLVQDARDRASDHVAALVAAGVLEAQAADLESSGDAAAAAVAADEAEEQRAVAARALLLSNLPVDLATYLVDADGDGRAVLDEAGLRRDLVNQAQVANRVDPGTTVREANRLRDESQHFDGWIVPLVGCIALLTLAQISRARVLRALLTLLATAGWITATAFAFGGPS